MFDMFYIKIILGLLSVTT